MKNLFVKTLCCMMAAFMFAAVSGGNGAFFAGSFSASASAELSITSPSENEVVEYDTANERLSATASVVVSPGFESLTFALNGEIFRTVSDGSGSNYSADLSAAANAIKGVQNILTVRAVYSDREESETVLFYAADKLVGENVITESTFNPASYELTAQGYYLAGTFTNKSVQYGYFVTGGSSTLQVVNGPNKSDGNAICMTKASGSSDTYLRVDFPAGRPEERVIYEMDTKVNQTGQIILYWLFAASEGGWSPKVDLFDSNGKIAGSNIAYDLNIWRKVRIDLNQTTKKADIYYNGQYACTKDFTLAPKKFRLQLETAGMSLSIDNFKVYEPSVLETPYIAKLGYTVGSDSTVIPVTAVSPQIPSVAKSIVLTMSSPIEAVDDFFIAPQGNISGKISGTVVVSGKKITIPLNEKLSVGTDYMLSAGETAELAFRPAALAGRATREGRTTTYKLFADESRTVNLMVAAYENKKLADVDFLTVLLNEGKNEQRLVLERAYDDVKVMCWDTEMRPLLPAVKPGSAIEEQGFIIFRNVTFDVAGEYSTGGNTITVNESEGNSYLTIDKTVSNTTARVDFAVGSKAAEKLVAVDSYVVECYIKPEVMDADLEFLAQKSEGDLWRNLYEISVDDTATSNWTDCGRDSLPVGKWSRASMVFDNTTGKMNYFVDGVLKKADISFQKLKPLLYRIEARSGGNQTLIHIDNFRIYEGSELKEDSAFEGEVSFFTEMETAEDALAVVSADDFVLMVNNGAYLTGGKKAYSSVKPLGEGDGVMIPVSLVADGMGYTVQYSGDSIIVNNTATLPVNMQDSTAYVSLRALADGLSKQYYWDDRGFAVVSQNPFTLRDSAAVQVLDEPIDILYRYLQFERPSGTELYRSVTERNPDNAHPRLLGTKSDMERIKRQSVSNSRMNGWKNRIITSANQYAQTIVGDYVLDNGVLLTATEIKYRLRMYSAAYLLTADEKYYTAAWRDLEKICTVYPDWDDYRQFLSAAEIAGAVAVSYDMFYDVLSGEQKQIIRDALVKNALKPGMTAYQGVHTNGYWFNGHDNWTSVCAGGLMCAALAIVDEEDTRDISISILENTIQSFENVMSLFYPDGGWYEGLSYQDYSMEYVWLGLASLQNASGGLYGLLDAPGAEGAADFALAMHGMGEGVFNYHDATSGFGLTGSYLWLANQFGISDFAENFFKILAATDDWKGRPEIMLFTYRPDSTGASGTLPLDSYFRQGEAGSMRQAWTEEALWAGVHAGSNGIEHDHLDLGEFVFEADGVRWVDDLGRDNYSIPGYFQERGYDIYRKRPEANNCLVINPREGYWGQSISCTTEMTRMASKEKGAYMIFDLTNAYTEDASKVSRGFMLGDNRRSFLIRDEVTLKTESDLYWFMNTSEQVASIDIAEDGKSAMLSTAVGKKLKVEFVTDADSYTLETMQMVPLPTSPTVAGMADDSGRTKLVIKLHGSGNVNLSVKLIPQMGDTADITPVDNTPIADWLIPD